MVLEKCLGGRPAYLQIRRAVRVPIYVARDHRAPRVAGAVALLAPALAPLVLFRWRRSGDRLDRLLEVRLVEKHDEVDRATAAVTTASAVEHPLFDVHCEAIVVTTDRTRSHKLAVPLSQLDAALAQDRIEGDGLCLVDPVAISWCHCATPKCCGDRFFEPGSRSDVLAQNEISSSNGGGGGLACAMRVRSGLLRTLGRSGRLAAGW